MAALALYRGPVAGGRRLIEWTMVAAVLTVFALLFLHKSLDVQAQAELAAVRTNLAALRTAMVLEYIGQKASPPRMVVNSQRNPFFLLQQLPGNYHGENDVARLAATGPGWYFDPTCDCVAYLASDARFVSESGVSELLLFQLVRSGGPTRLQALGRYAWQGQTIE